METTTELHAVEHSVLQHGTADYAGSTRATRLTSGGVGHE